MKIDDEPMRICPVCRDEGYACVTCRSTGINPDWRKWNREQRAINGGGELDSHDHAQESLRLTREG